MSWHTMRRLAARCARISRSASATGPIAVAVTEYYVCETVDGKDVCLHRFSIRRGEGESPYTQLVSVQAFHNRMLEWFGPKWKGGLPHRHFDIGIARMGILPAFAEVAREEKVPEVEHASLWDFYTAIGYDHKKRRVPSEWTKPTAR